MDVSNVALEIKEDKILYISSPHINELCCILCEIDFIEFCESSAKSNFHWRTLKCRLLIYLVSDIIASPILGTEKYIFIITRKTFFESGKLEQILKYLKLVYLGSRPVTDEVYKNCLFYTIQAKIAPRWNKVDQFLVQGKEFYNCVESSRALKLYILLQDKNVCLKLCAERVNVPYVKLEDYLPSSVISHFFADPKGYIDLSYYNLPFVHVLPSMKRGKLLSVSKEIPTTCVFKDYNQMRRHWKNMYGYSLPKSGNGILYFEIKFPVPRSNTFIYPHICIISGPIDILSSKDKELTITQFVSDMIAKLPTICGNQLKVSKHAFHNTSTLNTNITSDELLQNKQLIMPLKRKYDPSSTMPLELSATYVDRLKGDTDTTSKSLETQLAKIHKIHNTLHSNTYKADISSKNIKNNKNEDSFLNITHINNTQTTKEDSNKAGPSGNLNIDILVTKEETISEHFKICKPHTHNDRRELVPDENLKDLTLKEKLLIAKSTENNKIFLHEKDQYEDVEVMAKHNQLHMVKNSVLSMWLKKHSIPHNSKATKIDLINKVLSHTRNTQLLKQFRI